VIIDPNVFISALMAKSGSAAVAAAQAVVTDKLTLVA
jgi:predicted nucleic acid-binding protein